MKKHKKQLLSLLLAVTLIFGMLPVQVFADEGDTARVLVTDVNGNVIPNATVTVEYRYYSILSRWTAIEVDDAQAGQGIYTFKSEGNNYYRITVTVPGYKEYSYTSSARINPDNSTTFTATLEEEGAEYMEFEVFYYLSGSEEKPFPDSYYGSGDVGNYGPSQNDTPLVTIQVDIAKLRRMPDVVEGESGGDFYFIPANTNQDVAEAEKFWASVWECVTESSKEDFEATGLSKEFVGYCLKEQGTNDYHLDGILKVTPPVYVIEMYHNGTYFAGEAVDATHPGMDVYDVLAFCENYIGYTITWKEDDLGRPALVDGKYQGTYVTDTHLYEVTIDQKEINNKPTPHASGLTYYEMNSQYYLAQFEVEVTQVQKLVHTVVYTDGVADEVVYNDHTYAVDNGEKVPEFTGIYTRKGYTFAGWVLEGGDGTVLSDEQAQALTVNRNMTFHAVWQVVPKYEGRVELVLNGTYDSATHTATGDRISAETIRGPGTKLYVKEENAADIAENYILLNATGETGVYTAQLENGNYYFFYSVAGDDTKISTGNQLLTINNENRTRYLFYNSVTYDLNGGSGGPSALTEYHRSGYSVNVTDAVPTREGYNFLGWEVKDPEETEKDKVYQKSELLTADIGKAYTLVAKWDTITRAKVNLHLEIVHTVADQGTDPENEGDLEINLMYRPKNSGEPYVEVVGNTKERTVAYTKTGDTEKITTVTYSDIFTDLSTDYEYSANAFLDHYYNVHREVTATADAKGNVTYDVNIRLQFDPDLFHLQFDVVADSSIPDDLIPKAVDIKVLSYDAQTPNAWAPISRHQDYSVDVLLDGRTGSGSYNVLAHRTDESHYYYRLRPAGFTLADGTELVTTKVLQEDGISYIHYSDPSGKYPQGAFYAIVTVKDGKEPAEKVLPGVYAVAATEGDAHSEHVQKGTLTVTVYANLRKVTFNPNGGKLNGSDKNTVLENQFFIPDLQNYIPIRDGGYVFDGWYLADENGNMTATQAVSNTGITEDVTLVAKWREPITIQGQIAIAGSYVLDNNVHIIQEAGRLKEVVVALQHIDANGYAETYHTQIVTLTYEKVDGNVSDYEIGLGEYKFPFIHDEDHEHRILVLAPNYTTLYHNEYSEAGASDYEKYDEISFLALDKNSDKVAVVNAALTFTPDSFDLKYEVDASKIGATFRPNCVEILVTYDGDPLIMTPHKWPVISQMVFGEENRGIHTKLDAAGKGSDSLSVWKTFPDGATAYDYGIRVEMTAKEEEKLYDENTSPFTVEYKAPAHWTGTEQSQMLQATLIPKQYPIHYELYGGGMTASCPTAHTWSYETDLSKAIPVRAGYAFEGWYLDAGLTEKAPATISAETAAETTLHAKWAEAKDQVNLHVIVNHMHHEGGETNMYNKPLVVTLKRTDRGGAEYTEVSGQTKNYNSNYWHTVGDGADEEESYIVPVFADLSCLYDYTLDVSMEGYTLAKEPQVTRIYDEETKATTHEVTVVLQFAPDLLYLDFTVKMDDATAQWLDPEYVNVKVTCWYATNDIKLGWNPINQHTDTYVQVQMGENRIGTGSYPVWQWEEMPDTDGLGGKPWYYRIEPVELVFANGTVLSLSDKEDKNAIYTGGNYTARVEVAGDCVNPDLTQNLSGVYGIESGKHFVQSGTLTAVISATEHSVMFHTNLEGQADAFRTYVPNSGDGDYKLTQQGTIEQTYDLPTFDVTTHNNYIFRGWYLDKESDSRPIRFDGAEGATVFAGVTDVYAHWIEVGEVAKNPEDGKNYTDNYQGFDLVGVQIRETNTNLYDPSASNGTTGAGLRFVAVLSQNVYKQIEALSQDNPIVSGAEKPMEYGFVVATESAATRNANGKNDYTLQYKGVVNGVNTKEDYSYAVNMVCSGPTIKDHYEDDGNYRLFTAVITYKGSSAETQKGREFVARAYLRYNDANGLYRTHYNNYESENVTYGGVCISYNGAMDLLKSTQ